jgi:organic hydroperoxide reductase OsmC/OhrA
MQEADHFRVVAWWSSGQNGIAKSNSAPNAIHFTSPPSAGGQQGRWTPEDLLLSALVSSYTMTFRTLAEKMKFEHTDLEVEVEGVRNSRGDHSFDEVLVRATLIIPHQEQYGQAMELLGEARKQCFSSRALSIKQNFEALVTVRALGFSKGVS